MLQRGNYKGALTQFDRILDSMEVDEDTIPCASSLSNATLLLWAISLNTWGELSLEGWKVCQILGHCFE